MGYRSGGLFEKKGVEGGSSDYRHKDGYGGYWVQHANHWVFEGTGLHGGEVFGRGRSFDTSIIGHESDGTSFNCASDGKSIFGPAGNTGTPSNFLILGVAPVSRATIKQGQTGFSVMGIATNPSGGAVFSGSTTNWVHALRDRTTAQITRNVLDHFLTGDFPQEPIRNPEEQYLFRDGYNCSDPYHDGALPPTDGTEWYRGVPSFNYTEASGNLSKLEYSKSCGIEGGTGLKITVDEEKSFTLTSQIKPNWHSSDTVYMRMYLDLSNLRIEPGKSFTLIKQLYDDRHTKNTKDLAYLNIARTSDIHKQEELILIYKVAEKNGGACTAKFLKNQKIILETLWDRPLERLGIFIDNVEISTCETNLSMNESINRIDITLEGLDDGIGGDFCLDDFIIHDAPIAKSQ